MPAPPVPELTVEDAAQADMQDVAQAEESPAAPADVTEEEGHEITQ